jgi:xanthine dehydrogenase accessory factor
MFQEIAAALERGEPLALMTVVKVYGAAPCPLGARLLVRADGSAVGTFGGAATDARAREDGLKALASGEPGLITYHLDPEGGESVGSCGASLEVFVEPVRPESRLLVAGSGYVAQALARLAVATGWRVTLLDDRTEFVRAAQLPEKVQTEVGDLPELLVRHRPDAMTAVVIVTRGHRADRDALRAAIATPAGYVGMIGSRGKVRQIFRALRREGVSADDLARVYAPIGLDLRAETPDEIALSIAAELLMWRRGGTGRSLRDEQGILAQVLAEREDAPEAAADEDEPPQDVPQEQSAAHAEA